MGADSSSSWGIMKSVDQYFGKSDPFFEILSEEGALICSSHTVMDNLNPEFPEVHIPIRNVLDLEAPIRIQLKDSAQEDGEHQLLGDAIETTLEKLILKQVDGEPFELVVTATAAEDGDDEQQNLCGKLYVTKAEIKAVGASEMLTPVVSPAATKDTVPPFDEEDSDESNEAAAAAAGIATATGSAIATTVGLSEPEESTAAKGEPDITVEPDETIGLLAATEEVGEKEAEEAKEEMAPEHDVEFFPPEEENITSLQPVEDEVDVEHDNGTRTYNDSPSEMTYGRRLARYLSDTYEWYNPSKQKENGPSLDEAWEFFEHSKLPRHFLEGTHWKQDHKSQINDSFHQRKNQKDLLQRAEYGERDEKTVLYSLWGTPEKELGDFGLGVGIYFWTIKCLGLIIFIAGLIQVPNMIYFASDEHSDGQQENVSTYGVLGSAVCTDTKWVACPTCTRSQFNHFPRDFSRFATTSDGKTFIFRNECTVTLEESLFSWGAFLFVMLSIFAMNFISQYRERYIDSLSQTTTDYSVEVQNPPADAKDPEEWKDFFYSVMDKEKIHVTVVTVAVDNEHLIKKLTKRRQLIHAMEYLVKADVKFDRSNLEEMSQQTIGLKWWEKLMFKQSGPALWKSIQKLDEQIREASAKEMAASNVFVTFETERQQRHVLDKLDVPLFKVWTGGVGVSEKKKFRGEHTLSVREPPEPSSVRWHDLDESFALQLVQRIISTVLVVSSIIAGALLVEWVKRTTNATYAALTITAINQVTPQICKFCNGFESHASDGSRQASLYTKTTLFKWTSTAVSSKQTHC